MTSEMQFVQLIPKDQQKLSHRWQKLFKATTIAKERHSVNKNDKTKQNIYIRC